MAPCFKIALFVLSHNLCRARPVRSPQTSATDAIVQHEGLGFEFPEQSLIRNITSYSSLEWVQRGKKSKQEMRKKVPKERKIRGCFTGILYWKALDRKNCLSVKKNKLISSSNNYLRSSKSQILSWCKSALLHWFYESCHFSLTSLRPAETHSQFGTSKVQKLWILVCFRVAFPLIKF